MRTENDKNRDASKQKNDEQIKTQISLKILDFMKIEDSTKEEIFDLVTSKKFQETVNIVTDLIKIKQENIADKSNENNKKLDSDIIKIEETLDYVRKD